MQPYLFYHINQIYYKISIISHLFFLNLNGITFQIFF